MKQPSGYEDAYYPLHVCKLKKALYGLKQAPRAWHSKLSTKLQEIGFRPSRADTSLFIYRNGGVTLYMHVYVDDIIITGSSPQLIDQVL